MIKKTLYYLTICILLSVVIFCGYTIHKEFSRYWKDYNASLNTNKTVDREGKTVNWDKLPDSVIGWIYCKDSVLDYPLVQSKDNKEYLHTDYNGKYQVSGTIFADKNIENPFLDKYTLFYGHHMHNGTVFHDLKNYDDDTYYKNHKTIYFYTREQNYKATVVAINTIHAEDKIIYGLPKTSEVDMDEFCNYVQNNFKTFEEFDSRDKFVVLSTCAYSFKDARTVVVCKIEPINQDIKTIEKDKPVRKSKFKVFIEMCKNLIKANLEGKGEE